MRSAGERLVPGTRYTVGVPFASRKKPPKPGTCLTKSASEGSSACPYETCSTEVRSSSPPHAARAIADTANHESKRTRRISDLLWVEGRSLANRRDGTTGGGSYFTEVKRNPPRIRRG